MYSDKLRPLDTTAQCATKCNNKTITTTTKEHKILFTAIFLFFFFFFFLNYFTIIFKTRLQPPHCPAVNKTSLSREATHLNRRASVGWRPLALLLAVWCGGLVTLFCCQGATVTPRCRSPMKRWTELTTGRRWCVKRTGSTERTARVLQQT